MLLSAVSVSVGGAVSKWIHCLIIITIAWTILWSCLGVFFLNCDFSAGLKKRKEKEDCQKPRKNRRTESREGCTVGLRRGWDGRIIIFAPRFILSLYNNCQVYVKSQFQTVSYHIASSKHAKILSLHCLPYKQLTFKTLRQPYKLSPIFICCLSYCHSCWINECNINPPRSPPITSS